MALINCPECGHQVSDHAPYCPNCGIEIAGKINITKETPQQVPSQPAQIKEEPANNENEPTAKKKSHTPLIISFIIALIVCALCLYFYTDANNKKESEAYEYAMQSNDIQVLEDYLLTYTDAPLAHRDSINSHLEMLKMGDQEWNNAVVSGTKAALVAYIEGHPNSLHLTEARHLIDSIDWAKAQNDEEALETYIAEHGQGEHIDDAMQMQKKREATKVNDADRQMIFHVFDSFFTSLSMRDESLLTSTLNSLMDSFIGKPNATKNDALSFLHRIYKEDVNNMQWTINNDYKITKKAVEAVDGDEEFEYTVSFSVDQKIDRTDPSKETFITYKVNAKVTPELKITELDLTKINN